MSSVMKFFKYIYYFLSLGFIVSSCKSDMDNEGEGYIQLSGIEVNKNVNSRAESQSTEQIAVKITKGTEIFKQADDWTTLEGESFLVPAGGEYTVTAYSFGKDVEIQGFDAKPYYRGEKKLLVEAGKSHTVNVICTLAQSIVKVSYSDKFKEKFSSYNAIVKGSDGLSIPFYAEETREAFLKSGQPLTVSLYVTPNGGEQQSIDNTIAESAKAAYRYNVNFDVQEDSNGKVNISVSVDQTLNQYDVTLVIPDKPEGIATNSISNDVSKVWGKFAILSGECSYLEPVSPVQFKYKKVSDAEWLTVDAQKVGDTKEYTAKVSPLEFATEYQYKIVYGTEEGDVCTFTTEQFEEIPNLNFNTWNQNGKNWFANSDASDSYWATGNTGVTGTFPLPDKDPITVRTDDAVNGYAAEMHTLTGITLVKAAAGNLFIGSYKTNYRNPSASVTFGRPYTGARPTKLKGYYKYKPTNINSGDYPGNLTTDECNIYLKLWAEDGTEIGFGEFVGKEKITEYTPFEFDINYSVTNKRPAKITIVITSSHYGGYFVGSVVKGQVGEGSTLWVDEFELSYE